MSDTTPSLFTTKNIMLGLLVLLSGYLIYDALPQNNDEIQLGALPIVEPNLKYGMVLDTFITKEDVIGENEFIADIFLANNVSYNKMTSVLTAGKDIFDVRSLRAGKPYTFLYKDTTTTPDFFVYDASPYKYYLFDLQDDKIEEVKKPIEYRMRHASGTIESSLWNAFVDNGMNPQVAVKMEDAFGYSLSLYHLMKGDRFKLVYEEELIDGELVGIGKLHAAVLENSNKTFYAFSYESKEYEGYFDEEARTMKKQFLRSPLEIGYISSKFNPRRFHPIDKRVKPHKGTDYAAPRGTPIRAVANGVVTKASRTRGNGNYVKIKHDKTYQTQYLHMQRFAKGITPGAQVKQGETIGYVGSTGKATGPHVCFRFWKNGTQVDHLRLNFPPADPMPADEIPSFMVLKDSLNMVLESIPYRENEEEVVRDTTIVASADFASYK